MELSDTDRLRNLLGAYCRRIDAGDFAGLGALFADATLRDEHGTVIATGAAEVEALYGATTKLHDDGTPRTQHLLLNTTFDEAATADVAVARSSYVVLQATADFPLQPVITGSYVDSFTRTDVGWHFTDRTFAIRLVGDLAQHLTFEPPTGAR
jgi:hypothetical protein